jgi:hypothetical protein
MKTWMLSSLALSVAGGTPWLGAFPTQIRRVLYIDYEQGEYETRRRIKGLSQPLENFDLWEMPELNLTDPDFEVLLKEIIVSEGYGLVAIDSMAAGSQGTTSENDARYAAPLRAMKRVAAQTGAGIVILHHARKARQDKDGENIVGSDARQEARGTGAIYAAADVMLMASKVSDSEALVAHAKARGSAELKPFSVTIQGMAPEHVTLVCLTHEDRERAAFLKNCAGILRALARTPGQSGNDLLKMLGGKRESHIARLRRLEVLNIVRREGDGWYLTGSRGQNETEIETGE